MHKITNFTGGMRHGWEMPFGVNRSQHHDMAMNQAYKRGQQPPPLPPFPPGTPISLCFKVPFNNTLPGPEPEQVIWASPGAVDRWTHPEVGSEEMPAYKLPVHAQHFEDLRARCSRMKAEHGVEATVTLAKCIIPTPVLGGQPTTTKPLVAANVCLYGNDYERARRVREMILNESPITMNAATIPIDRHLIFSPDSPMVDKTKMHHIDDIANRTKADIFLLDPEKKQEDGSFQTASKEPLKVMVYGDMLTKENAKIRILVMIDQILNRHVDTMKLELTLHTLICGRARKKIKNIESATDTAIYFPPTFPGIHLYRPEGAERRSNDEIVITGPDPDHIYAAKAQLHDLVLAAKNYAKEIRITHTKVDHLLLERLDKIQSIMEAHASHVLLPPIGRQQGSIRIQGLDLLNVERTARDIMALASEFYSAEWKCAMIAGGPQPSESQIQTMLSDVCASSGADVIFSNMTFYAFGSDECVRHALMVISNIPFVKKASSTIHVKLELANEHKEFVSGKKNGKLNKIMNTARVNIVFDGFNEYNFYIDVRGQQYDTTMYGLELVEMELPASLSFHVPDQYHKRIIGIGGQHIQQLMKKYSVFVKFSNAHDRGPVIGKEDEAMKLDNVICRTPSRNAFNLELVKQEIMDMVNRPDAEQVTEQVQIDRLFHRELIGSHMDEIVKLEKKWNCKITFPSTEQASDVVLVSGPEFQVPQATYELLSMVPESHEVVFTVNEELKEYLSSSDFRQEVSEKMKSQYVVDVNVNEKYQAPANQPDTMSLLFNYTRNNAGGLKDAIDFLLGRLVRKGLDANTVKGMIPRPKSDSFEDSLPFFDSKILHRSDGTMGTDSPTRSQFGDNEGEQTSFFSKFRRPGGSMSSFTSLMGTRNKNGSNSPGSLFKHASSNASKASLASIDSQASSYRNPWNDSGINLPEGDLAPPSAHGTSNGGWQMPPHPHTAAVGQPAYGHHPNFAGAYGPVHAPGMLPGDATPTGAHGNRYDPRASVDSGRPSTSHSFQGYPPAAGGPGMLPPNAMGPVGAVGSTPGMNGSANHHLR